MGREKQHKIPSVTAMPLPYQQVARVSSKPIWPSCHDSMNFAEWLDYRGYEGWSNR